MKEDWVDRLLENVVFLPAKLLDKTDSGILKILIFLLLILPWFACVGAPVLVICGLPMVCYLIAKY